MKSRLSPVAQRYRRLRRHWRREGGNTAAISALVMVALIGVMALVIDIGFLAGQRRFMQNAADAAALAAGEMLAHGISRNSSTATFPTKFIIKESRISDEARRVATLNQNAGLTARTTSFTVQIDYCVASSPSGYIYDPANANFRCRLYTEGDWTTTVTGGLEPGFPVDGTYMVRARVSSTITTLFGRVLGTNATTTSARASAMILGACTITAQTGNILPFTLWDNQDFGTGINQVYELWGSTAPSPSFAGSWQNVLDLTSESKWCDGTNPDYKWNFRAMIPTNVHCSNFSGTLTGLDLTWNRSGYGAATGCYAGNDQNDPDLALWASVTFSGSLRSSNRDANNNPVINTGNKIPTYQDAQPAQNGNGGNNVATGVYGSGLTTCSPGVPQYLLNGQPTDPDHSPNWGRYRDVVVFTYNNPEWWNTSTNTWTATPKNGQAPNRVELYRRLTFRVYESPPGVSGSRVFGRVISEPAPSNSQTCGGPSYERNIVRLGQ